MNCNEATKLMAFEFGTYAPICNEGIPEQWEPCQCAYGDGLTEVTCVCVDENSGEPLEHGEIAVIDTSNSSGYSHYSHYSGWCEDHCRNNYYPGLSSNRSNAASSSSAKTVEAEVKCVGAECSQSVPSDNVNDDLWDSPLVHNVAMAIIVFFVTATVARAIYIWKAICPRMPRNAKYQAVASVDASDTDCV